MLDKRIALMVANNDEQQPYFFPFTLGGICSQISPSEAVALKKVDVKLTDDIYLHVANTDDSTFLYDLLRSYGTNSCNYENLEIFAEEKLDIVVRNMTHCLEHRFFITFLLICNKRPIAFFQVDPYRMEIIESIYQNKLLPRWNTFLDEPIDLHRLAAQNETDCKHWLENHINIEAFKGFIRSRNLSWKATDGLKFVFYSIQTYKLLRETLLQNHWLGNISYNVLPEFQHKGLMSKMISAIESILAKYTDGYGLFSDRIADKNKRSVALLEKLNFNKLGTFLCYYGEDYHTRAHPQGNFSESCVCFYKKIV